MPEEILKKIEGAEREAEESLKMGKEEGKRIIEEAREKAREILLKGEREGKIEGRRIRDKLLNEAEKESKRTRGEFQVRRRKIEEGGRKRMEKAVRFIVNKAREAMLKERA